MQESEKSARQNQLGSVPVRLGKETSVLPNMNESSRFNVAQPTCKKSMADVKIEQILTVLAFIFLSPYAVKSTLKPRVR